MIVNLIYSTPLSATFQKMAFLKFITYHCFSVLNPSIFRPLKFREIFDIFDLWNSYSIMTAITLETGFWKLVLVQGPRGMKS